MSERAKQAYANGYAPKSKWTKKYIIEQLYDIRYYDDDEIFEQLKKFTQETLYNVLIEYKEWHHVSRCANKTNFYGFKDKYINIKLDPKEMIEDLEYYNSKKANTSSK